MSSFRLSIALLALLIAMVTVFMWPTLGGTLFFGYADNGIHGLPLVELHARILRGGESAMWSPLVYGGHPLFAESQGAFANPVNILLSWLLPPVLVSSLLHWLGFAMGVTGMFALARVMGLSPWASAFTATAAVFSPFWLGINTNMTVTAAVGWVPWCLWAFEGWLKRLDTRSALIFGALATTLILTGYPHLLHACVMYMVISLLPSLFSTAWRRDLLSRRRAFMATGLLAVLVTCGLAAVQLLPLAELIGQSHRSESVKLGWFAFPDMYYRGFFFAPDERIEAPVTMLPSIGSLMVCVLAIGGLLWRPTARIAGATLATYLLGNLAMGYASPIFNFVYEHNLVPMIHKIRITHPFFLPALIGTALLAGAALDGLTTIIHRYRDRAESVSKILLRFLPGLAAALVTLLWGVTLFEPPLSRFYIVTGVAVFGVIAIAGLSKRPQWLSPVLLTLLIIEAVHLKLVPPVFAPTTRLHEPVVVQSIPSAQRRDYKFLDLADTAAASIRPSSERVNLWLDRVLEAVAPSSNLLWDVPSIGGSFALNLARQALVETWLRSEASGDIRQVPGLRLLDFLGLRYITAPAQLSTPGLELQRHDDGRAMYFYVNESAQRRFQHFGNAILAQDAASAFEQVKQLQQRKLVIEANAQALADIGATSSLGDDNDVDDENFRIDATQARSDAYAFNVANHRGGWLFIADSMYPGWIATLDGKPTPVFAAQVLGKAVWVPAGDHKIEVRFVSRSFQIGLAITLLTLAAIAAFLIIGKLRRGRIARTAR